MRLPLFGLLVVAGVALIPGLPVANAQERPAQAATQDAVNAEVVVLHATNDGSGIDPKIGKMPELGKPPFSAYNSYKLLERLKVSLQKGKPTTTKLPNGSVLMVSLKDVVAAKKKDEPKRFVVSASIQKPGGTTFLPLLEVNAKAGENFFVAGQQHMGGVLVIGIKVAP